MAPTVCLSESSLIRATSSNYLRRRVKRMHGSGSLSAIGRPHRLELKPNISINVAADDDGTLLPPPVSGDLPWNLQSQHQRPHQNQHPNHRHHLSQATNDSYRCNVPKDINYSPKVSSRIPAAHPEDTWRIYMARREGLLNIVARTMALVRRNYILQERVNALRAETRDFICSVLNNPGNKCRQEKCQPSTCSSSTKESTVSSSTETSLHTKSIINSSSFSSSHSSPLNNTISSQNCVTSSTSTCSESSDCESDDALSLYSTTASDHESQDSNL